MSNKPATYYSPTLARLKREAGADDEVVCASCRASMWPVTNSRLTRFCKEARLISWDGKQDRRSPATITTTRRLRATRDEGEC